MLYATQLLTQIELTMASQSLTIQECKDIAAEYGPQHERAEAAGKLIHTVNQWAAADEAELPGGRKRPPTLPTLLGGNGTTTVARPRMRHDDASTQDDDAVPADQTTTDAEKQKEREQHEQEAVN